MYLSIKSLTSWIVVGLCLFLITSVQELRFLFDLDRIARKFERKGREDGAQGKPAISDGAFASWVKKSFCDDRSFDALVYLEDYTLHENPPGISDSLVEGRIVYDAFVLDNKAKAIYYQEQTAESAA